MKVVATGPSGPASELDPLREAGHEVVIGRPLDSALRRVDPTRLVLTPHNASHSQAGRRANLRLALEQILAVGRGEPPRHTINPEAIPRWRTAYA